VPVCDDAGAVVGVVSEADILHRELGRVDVRGGFLGWVLDPGSDWVAKAKARTAAEAMTAPAITALPYESAAAAARRMTEKDVNRLPVVTHDGRLVGIVTRADLVRAFVRRDDVVAAEIRDEVLRRTLWVNPGTVAVSVRDGEVELAGQLDTEAEVEVLESLVAKVPGVVAVRSEVTYKGDKVAAGR
jgi:CBS-domain-containing membrane protein